MATDMDDYNSEDDDDFGETFLYDIPNSMIGYIIGHGGRRIQKLKSDTETYITAKSGLDDKTYFIIQGKAKNRRQAKLKIENTVELLSSGTTQIYIPQYLISHAIGSGGKTKNKIMEETNTFIRTETVDDEQTYILIQGKEENRHQAKTRLKMQASKGQLKIRGLQMTLFPCVDAQEGTFVLQPIESTNGNISRLVLKSSSNEDSASTGNFNRLYQELLNISRKYEDKKNRSLNVWCHFGRIHIRNCPDVQGKEYTLHEIENHVVPKEYLAPDETKWNLRFSSGLNATEQKHTGLNKWFSPREQTGPRYWRHEMTFLTPSCFELRLKVFVIPDQKASNEQKSRYQSAKCPHEIHNVIMSSDSPPYFYICEATYKTALVDIFEPSAQVDIRLIAEANLISLSSVEAVLLQEASIFYNFVKNNLKITDQGEMMFLQEKIPKDFDVRYSRVAERTSYRVRSPDGNQFTARLSHETHNDIEGTRELFGDLDIHLLIDDCSSKTSKEIIDQVPHLLNCARRLARVFENESDQNIVPSEILARGQRAQSAYQTALKSGKVKNCRVPIVLVGQSRSGKTSLLRSIHREEFNPSEDSTIGAKLQRSLSKAEDADWHKTNTDEHTVYNRCAARAMIPHLLVVYSMDSNDDDDNDEPEFNKENLIPVDNIVNNSLETSSEEDKPLTIEENLKVDSDEEITQEDFEKSLTGDVQSKQLPEQVAICAKNILENPESAKQMENDLFLHTMDFAGQPVYSVTHPVFLPPKGIFLLVHNLENDLHAQATPMVKCGAAERIIDDHCPMTNMDHLESWLSLIAANSTIEGGSPVFVVSTHADKPFKPDVKQTARQILQTLKREDFAPRSHVVNGLYTVDNTVSGSGGPDDPGVQRLKVTLSNEARNLPQLNEDIPIRWLSFEKRLLSLVSEKKEKYISREDAKTIALECGVDVNSDEFNTLLDYLHDLKVIIYFPETNMIIIDTQWLLDMFAKVITVQPIECHHKKYESEWRKLEEHGIISVNFLKHLWCDLLDDHASFQSLIDIMEKFSLICNWKQLDGGTSYLVPAMLMNTSEEKANALVADNLAPPLVIRFDCSHLPFAIFPRLLVLVEKMCNSKWPCSSPPHLSKNFARFYIVDDKCAFSLVFTSDLQTIRVALFNDKTKGNNRNGFFVNLCKWLTEFLEGTLQKMIESFPWMRRLELEFGICCPVCKDVAPCKKHSKRACPRDSCFHFISKQELLSTTQTRCGRSPTKLNNEIPYSSFSHWFDRKDNNTVEVKKTHEQLQALCLPSEDDAVCKEVIAAFNEISLKTISQDEVARTAKRIAGTFNLDKHNTATPPKDIIQKCRTNCRWLVAKGGVDFVKALQEELPSGMTGPLKFGQDVTVSDMDAETKLQFSEALTANEMEWKAFAKEKVKLSHYKIEYLDKREKNPVLEILNEYCRDWSVEELYEAVAVTGAAALVDHFL